MNYTQNKNYFIRSEMPVYIGAAMMVVGVFLLFFFPSGAIPFVVIGLIGGFGVYLYGCSNRAGEATIREEKDAHLIRFGDIVQYNDPYARRIVDTPAPRLLGGYELGDIDGLLYRKMKNGSYCTSTYTAAKIFFTKDSLILHTRTFSFVEKYDQTNTVEYPFLTLAEAHMERQVHQKPGKKEPLMLKDCRLVLTGKENQVLFSIPVHDDLEMEAYTRNINHLLNGETLETTI